VITPGTQRTRWTAPLAAVLLVIQGIAGGVVSLAHASERLTAPVHIEAQHGSGCVVLHDELRCVLCHYAGTHVVLQPVRAQPGASTGPEQRPDRRERARPSGPDHLTAPPRAPPVHSV
jgi:hypothetical protein